MNSLIIFFLWTFVPYVNSYTYPEHCKIAFRMDDIQDGWLVSTQIEIMQKFLNAKIPLTIGIIDNVFGLHFDPSSMLVPFLRNNLASGGIEIAFHSPDHIAMTLFNLSEQVAQLIQGQTNLYGPSSKLPENPHPMVSFIPPYNAFDANTITAMTNVGYLVISASADPGEATIDGVEFYDNCPTTTVDSIYHWPEDAATADDSANPYTASDTVTLIRQQLANCSNFSVVMLHFVEFSINGTSNPNPTQLAQLDLVLAEALSSGCELRFLRTMGDPYQGLSTPTGPVAGPTALSPSVNISLNVNGSTPTRAPTAGSSGNMVSLFLLSCAFALTTLF